jgi:hypothetical protein
MDWFFSFSGERGTGTGESLPVSGAQPGAVMITPVGARVPLAPGFGAFTDTFYQGIYQSLSGGEKILHAVNLRDADESDLRQPAAILLSAGAEVATGTSVLLPFWPYFLLASLLLLLLEWFLKPRMKAFEASFGARKQRA